MGRTTSQASEVISVLRSYGLRHRTAKVQGITQRADFRVKTEASRVRDRETGQAWSEFGSAYGHTWSAQATQVVAEHASEIAAKLDGYVYLYYLDDDKGLRLVTAMVATDYAKGGRVVRYVNNDIVKEDPMASRAAQRQAQAKAADVKARAQANPRRGSRRPLCGNCGKPAGPSADALNLGPPPLCDQCYFEAGMENEHTDGYHDDEPNPDCHVCYPEKGLEPQPEPQPAKPKRTRTSKDPSRPSYRQVAEQYGDRIIKGREEHHYTWQGIAEVLHLIPRGDDVPRNTKVWGHVVVWNAYKLLKAQRGEEPVRKQLRGKQKSNGHAQVDHTATHNPNEPEKPKRQPKPKRDLTKPARTPAQRKAKALGLEALELAELIDRVQGRTISYTYNNSELGSATTTVAKVHKVQPTGKEERLAMWFFADVALVGKAKTPEYSNERTVYLDQIVEVS